MLSECSSLALAVGTLRPGGRRHDNDYVDFTAISIVPTEAELLCPLDPFLPANRQASSSGFRPLDKS